MLCTVMNLIGAAMLSLHCLILINSITSLKIVSMVMCQVCTGLKTTCCMLPQFASLSSSVTVIGRGGEMINRLQAESGARLQVAPGNAYFDQFLMFSFNGSNPDGSEINGERQVTIYGNTDAIE